ncbi:MAG TPA: hypothetical protein VG942_17930 [Hyphomonadaceae bacterium]|nr:hypothetical protein [Hyphomonadaceae bacterium]
MIRNLLVATVSFVAGVALTSVASALAGPSKPAPLHVPTPARVEPSQPTPAIRQKPAESRAYSASLAPLAVAPPA